MSVDSRATEFPLELWVGPGRAGLDERLEKDEVFLADLGWKSRSREYSRLECMGGTDETIRFKRKK